MINLETHIPGRMFLKPKYTTVNYQLKEKKKKSKHETPREM